MWSVFNTFKIKKSCEEKKNNLNKSYVHLHENLKENSYFL